MNEILVRTNRNFYNVGDTVYGLVYLNIVHPTTGHGVKVSINGYSKVNYNTKSKDIHSPENSPELQAEKNYIKCQDVVLYVSEDFFMIGAYIFPFKVVLPPNIPGSITVFGENSDAIWHAFVDYNIHAILIDCKELYTTETFQVRSSPPADYPVEVTSQYRQSFWMFWSHNYTVKARFNAAGYEAGDDNAMLLLHYDTTSKTKIKEITAELLMFLALTTNSARRSICEEIPDPSQPSYILPYGKQEEVVWQTCLTNTNEELSNNSIEIMIPLKNLSPTTNSEIIQCFYKVRLCITLMNKKSIDIDVPGPYILSPLDQQWSNRKCPDWMNKGKTTLPNVSLGDNFRVSRRLLYEEYFGLPGFLPL
ncbi:uncharacterized protein LOC115211206 [Argonauta hians]